MNFDIKTKKNIIRPVYDYEAANIFPDAFADYQQSLELRADKVHFGFSEDVGCLAEEGCGREARFDKRGCIRINESMLRGISSYSVMQQEATVPLLEDSSYSAGYRHRLPTHSHGMIPT